MNLRVAYCVPFLRKPSGWRSLSVGAIRALKAHASITPVVVVSQRDAGYARELLHDCELIVVPSTQSASIRRPRSWPLLAATYARVRAGPFPWVHLVHSLEAYPTGLVGHWISRRKGVPHIITAVGTYAVAWKGSRLDSAAYEQVLRQAQAICPISNGTSALVTENFGEALSGKTMRVVLLGTDYSLRISREEAYLRSPLEHPTVLSVGAIKPRKGYYVSLQAFRKVKAVVPSARYWIVGGVDDHGYYQMLRQYIDDVQLHDVEFLGALSQEEVRSYYKRATVFVLTPQSLGFRFEGFGLVYIEAGAYGLPAVGTEVGGVPEAIRGGETGFVLEPDDVSGIAEAVTRLLTDPELASRMGRRNRLWAEKLTWKRYAVEQSEVYRSVLTASDLLRSDRG